MKEIDIDVYDCILTNSEKLLVILNDSQIYKINLSDGTYSLMVGNIIIDQSYLMTIDTDIYFFNAANKETGERTMYRISFDGEGDFIKIDNGYEDFQVIEANPSEGYARFSITKGGASLEYKYTYADNNLTQI